VKTKTGEDLLGGAARELNGYVCEWILKGSFVCACAAASKQNLSLPLSLFLAGHGPMFDFMP